MKHCDACGRERLDTDVATFYLGDDILHFCHGVADESPTCYQRSEWEVPHLHPDGVALPGGIVREPAFIPIGEQGPERFIPGVFLARTSTLHEAIAAQVKQLRRAVEAEPRLHDAFDRLLDELRDDSA